MSDTTTIATYSNRLEAEIAQSFLQANGIRAIIFSDDAGGMYPNLTAATGIKLVVSVAESDQAQQLLASRPSS